MSLGGNREGDGGWKHHKYRSSAQQGEEGKREREREGEGKREEEQEKLWRERGKAGVRDRRG